MTWSFIRAVRMARIGNLRRAAGRNPQDASALPPYLVRDSYEANNIWAFLED
jgi:hypothetical protein